MYIKPKRPTLLNNGNIMLSLKWMMTHNFLLHVHLCNTYVVRTIENKSWPIGNKQVYKCIITHPTPNQTVFSKKFILTSNENNNNNNNIRNTAIRCIICRTRLKTKQTLTNQKTGFPLFSSRLFYSNSILNLE